MLKDREEYKKRAAFLIYKLYNAIMTDDQTDHPRHMIRQLQSEVQMIFDKDLWKPRPVFAGISQHVPLEQEITLHIIHYRDEEDPERGVTFLHGRIVNIGYPHIGEDGAVFSVIPKRCRNPRNYYFRVRKDSSISVCLGYVFQDKIKETPKVFEYAYL